MLRICKVDNCSEYCHGSGYCNLHYYRFKKHGDPLKTNRLKGVEHWNWKGGVTLYPADPFRRRQRFVILLNNPNCELCDKPAVCVHHRDKKKDNHELSNLMAVCNYCHTTKLHPKSRNGKGQFVSLSTR